MRQSGVSKESQTPEGWDKLAGNQLTWKEFTTQLVFLLNNCPFPYRIEKDYRIEKKTPASLIGTYFPSNSKGSLERLGFFFSIFSAFVITAGKLIQPFPTRKLPPLFCHPLGRRRKKTKLLKWCRKCCRVTARRLIRNWEGNGRCWLALCSCPRCWGAPCAFSSPARRWRRWRLYTRSRWPLLLYRIASPTARSCFCNRCKKDKENSWI